MSGWPQERQTVSLHACKGSGTTYRLRTVGKLAWETGRQRASKTIVCVGGLESPKWLASLSLDVAAIGLHAEWWLKKGPAVVTSRWETFVALSACEHRKFG